MKRDPALVPLSHDHHHGLVEARRLRRAAAGDGQERRRAAAAFLRFFAAETRRHFREEEERIFPLLVDAEAPATDLLGRALIEHQRLYALTSELEDELAEGEVPAARMREVAEALDEHIRFEERILFPRASRPNARSVGCRRRPPGPRRSSCCRPGRRGRCGTSRRTISTRRSSPGRPAVARPSTSTPSATSSSSCWPARQP